MWGGGKFLEVKNGASAPAVALARRRECLRGDVPPSEVGAFLKMWTQIGGGGKARFNVATPTYATVTCTRHVQHTYYRIIYKQNPFNIISRGLQGCTSTADFRLK